MSAEGAVSVGAQSVGVAAAGPSVGGIGTSVSAEFGASSGIGFDSGSPTFSGLGRSDTGLVSMPGFREFSPSISSVPERPVKGDIFNGTRDFSASIGSVPEGPVKGDVFGQIELIAQTQSLISDSARRGLVENISPPEPISIFDNTSPFQAEMPVNEDPVSFESLMDTVVIARSKEAVVENSFTRPEIAVEDTIKSFISSELPLENIRHETISNAMEDFKINNPVAAYELDQDLRLAEKVIEIAHEVSDAETAVRISNLAIDTAVDRSGLIESIDESGETSAQEEPEETEASAQTAQDQTENIIVDSRTDVEIEPDDPKPLPQNKKEVKTVRDGKANNARIENRNKALKIAFQEEIDPQTGKVDGKDVLEKVIESDEEQSKLAKEAGVDDGAIPEGDKIIGAATFDNEEQGETVIFQAVTNNTGVEEGESGTYASKDEAAKVLQGKKTYQAGQADLLMAA